jgi:hypothetical protein
MNVCLFLSFCGDVDADFARLDAAIASTPKLCKALVHTSSNADDPYVKGGVPPALVLQLYFAELPHLEAASSYLGVLKSREEFPGLAKTEVTEQAMLVRAFTVPEPRMPGCTYLVSYEGEAENLNMWLGHYIDSHVPQMARFPGLRELEVYTRLDWISRSLWPRVDFMQRNKVAFDNAEALTVALHSPVRHDMRADYEGFPPFTGPVRHFAMTTRAVHLHG